ncbi:putative transposase [Streptomyces lincolnensis]|uniref:Putative transposase n=1 Tax=Streptomyces lincolnensis TaxID=1915 RepID=A0A1B1MQ81_STRLN|nr:putative transposase [Streptomyces lincolnensis]
MGHTRDAAAPDTAPKTIRMPRSPCRHHPRPRKFPATRRTRAAAAPATSSACSSRSATGIGLHQAQPNSARRQTSRADRTGTGPRTSACPPQAGAPGREPVGDLQSPEHPDQRIRRGLRLIQYRSHLIDGCLAETGRTIGPA